jgi:endoglucanase
MNRRELVAGAVALAACAPAASQAPAAPFPMRRGVNLGNALEAENEGDWGYRIEADHLRAIAAAGFDGVRLPVAWTAHTEHDPPFAMAPAIFARVEEVVAQALASGLKVQLDLHHYTALAMQGPRPRHRARFLSMWAEIARRFRDAPAGLIFEPFNEPYGEQSYGEPWPADALMTLQREVVAVIRETNPQRWIVLGPSNWQNIDALEGWRLPPGANIAASVHYYEPYNFTHQRADWLGADAPAFDRAWGSAADRTQVAEHIARAARWARQANAPLQLGEFGVNRAAPTPERAAWTQAVREACEAHGVAWCVWDFAGEFPVWDAARGAFAREMLRALGVQ